MPGGAALTIPDRIQDQADFAGPATAGLFLKFGGASFATSAIALGDVVGLLSAGKIDTTLLPSIAISDFLGSVASQAAMLALTGQRGDWCVRSDTSTTWILSGDNASQLANWVQLLTPAAPVTSVNGQAGAVSLASTNLTDTATLLRNNADVITGAVNARFIGFGSSGDTGFQYATSASRLTVIAGFASLLMFNSSTGDVTIHASFGLAWGSSAFTAVDVRLRRASAGVLEINNGTNGTFRDLKLRNLTASGLVTCTTVNRVSATKTASFSADTGTGVYLCDASTANIVATLPDGAGSDVEWTFKRIDDGSSGHTVSITPSVNSIEGAASVAVGALGKATVKSDRTNYWVIG